MIRILAAAALALIACNGLWYAAWQLARTQRATALAQATTLRADLARQRAEGLAAARASEAAQAARIDTIRTIVEQELTDAATRHHQVVAALRADNLRLRQHWQGCAAAAVPAPGPAAGAADAAAHLRSAGAGDLVRIGAECDARIRALQRIAHAYAGATP